MTFATTILCDSSLTPVPPKPFTPLHTIWLVAQCAGLKRLLVEAQTKITGLEEQQRALLTRHSADAQRIADLIRRNQQLTSAVHRAACVG
jgi:hypothetical protein